MTNIRARRRDGSGTGLAWDPFRTAALSTWRLHEPTGTSEMSQKCPFCGGPSQTRTVDPLIKSQLLYQLS